SMTTTGASGAYQFSGLVPGSYTVQVDTTSAALAGYVPTTVNAAGSTAATDSNANPSTTAPLTSGGSDLTLDFGYYKPVTVGDLVWHDTNGNGIQDSGEPGIAGVTVKLYHGSTLVSTTTTSATGAYQFSGLAPGSYSVQVDTTSAALAGFVATAVNAAGSTAANDSNANPSTTAMLTSGSSDLTVDFGYYKPVTIGDLVWQDTNGNGIQDSGEPGIAGVTVKLYQGSTLLGTTTTSVNGAYQFSCLAPGSYTVQVDTTSAALAGYVPTTVNAAGSTTSAENSDNPGTVALLTSGGSDLTVDFGYYKPVTVGDLVWQDTNGNGIQDSGEQGIAGVTVKLYQGSTLLGTTTTSVNGAYQFSGLAPGSYTVQVDTTSAALAGYVPTTVNAA